MPELQPVARLDWRTIFTWKDGDPPKWFDEYFRPFAQPGITKGEDGEKDVVEESKCIHCESPLMGLLGTFEWGIAHGSGQCGKCGWPSRLYHFLQDDEGEDVGRLSLLLQYHPDAVSGRPSQGQGGE